MDREIRKAQFVLMICTEKYLRRVMGDEQHDEGLGIRWEGNLIYQHIYNAGSQNTKFIPVVFHPTHASFIPTPVQGSTRYCLATNAGYENLYARLIGNHPTQKPPLGRPKSQPKKEVQTDVSMYIAGPIDIELWDKAKWRATFFDWLPSSPPLLGLAFENGDAARKIFEGWRKQFGDNDENEELRISIIEGNIPGKEPGYTVHVGSDWEVTMRRLRSRGFGADKDLLCAISRLNRMTPSPSSKNLAEFKNAYRKFKTYYLVGGVTNAAATEVVPMHDLRIHKGRIHFRTADEIGEHDPDAIAIRPK